MSSSVLLFCFFTILCAFSHNCIYADNIIKKDMKIKNLYDMHFDKDSLLKSNEYHKIKGYLNIEMISNSKDISEELKNTNFISHMNQFENHKSNRLQQNNDTTVYEPDNEARSQIYNNPITSHDLTTHDIRVLHEDISSNSILKKEIPRHIGTSTYGNLWSHLNESQLNTEPYKESLDNAATTPHTRTQHVNLLSGIPSYYEDLPYNIGSSHTLVTLWRHARGGPQPPPHSGRPNHAGSPPHRGPPPPPESPPRFAPPPQGGFLPYEEYSPHGGPPPHAGPPHDGKPPNYERPPPNRGPPAPEEPTSYEESTQFHQTVTSRTATNSYTDVYQNSQNINYFTTTNPTHAMDINNNNQGNVVANTSQNDNPVTTRPPMYWFQAQAVMPEE